MLSAPAQALKWKKKKIITHQSLHLQPSRSAVKVGAERWQLLSQSMSFPGCPALGKGVMGRRAGKALASHFLECHLCAHPAAPAGSWARKAEQQHPSMELCRLVSIWQQFSWSVRDFQDKRAECNEKTRLKISTKLWFLGAGDSVYRHRPLCAEGCWTEGQQCNGV